LCAGQQLPRQAAISYYRRMHVDALMILLSLHIHDGHHHSQVSADMAHDFFFACEGTILSKIVVVNPVG
jgi:hypothetical protein